MGWWRPVVKCCLPPNHFILSGGADLRSRLQEAAGASQRLIDGVFRAAVSLPSVLVTNLSLGTALPSPVTQNLPSPPPPALGGQGRILDGVRAGRAVGLWEELSGRMGGGGDGSGVGQMRPGILVALDFGC